MLTAKFKPSSYTLYTILLLYAFITLIAVLRHELFVDEVSVFMDIHNLSFLGCIKQIIMEGHPFFLCTSIPIYKNWFFYGSHTSHMLYKQPYSSFYNS